MHQFNEDTAITKYIENLLRDSYIPTIRQLDSHSDAMPGETYIFVDHIYKNDSNSISSNPSYHMVDSDTYKFGKRYINMTTNYVSKYSYYSSETHEALGDYLRTYQNATRIGVMNLYNCFSNKYISNFSLPITLVSEALVGSEYNSNYKLAVFPVKPNTKYLIKLGASNADIAIQTCMWNGKALLTILNETGTPYYSAMQTINYINSTTVEVSYNESAILYNNRRYMHMFLQLPSTFDSYISIIEQPKYDVALNRTLENLDVNYSVPFSDKLIEYLTGNVICQADDIKSNVARIQTALMNDAKINSIRKRYDSNNVKSYPKGQFQFYSQQDANLKLEPDEEEKYSPYIANVIGYFDSDMRRFIYNLLINAGIPDFMGYVDKDVERILMQ